MTSRKTALIVGAGFSSIAGLPLQSEFTKQLLKAGTFKHGKSRYLMPTLGEFALETFGFRPNHDLASYPELEDIFTTLDLSANTGHHLGRKYAPKDLRRLRRILLSRIIRMLDTSYLAGKKKSLGERAQLLDFLSRLSEKKHEFVSLNWDLVLEGCLEEINAAFEPFYSPEIRPSEIKDNMIVPSRRNIRRLHISKMHGSINWLYCDCCRRSFSVPVGRVSRLASQVLQSEEEKELYGQKSRVRLKCPACDVDLGVRLATFSYQKALRAPMFESSWLQAEKSLRKSRRWVFIGYSLPAADFEFKYLLKRVELARKISPEILVVTKADSNNPDDSTAVRSYKRFFGEERPTFFYSGLDETAVNMILSE